MTVFVFGFHLFCLLFGGLLCTYLCLQLGGILAGFVCNKLHLSSWFRIRIYGSWKPVVSFEIHIHDLILDDRIRSYLTDKLSFHIPLRCEELTATHLRMKWVLFGPDRSVLPRLALDGVSLRVQVTSVADWNSRSSSSSSSSTHFPLSSSAPYAHVAWTKKHQLANHLSSLIEHYLRAATPTLPPAPLVSRLQTVYKDALIANLHISLCNLELR